MSRVLSKKIEQDVSDKTSVDLKDVRAIITHICKETNNAFKEPKYDKVVIWGITEAKFNKALAKKESKNMIKRIIYGQVSYRDYLRRLKEKLKRHGHIISFDESYFRQKEPEKNI